MKQHHSFGAIAIAIVLLLFASLFAGTSSCVASKQKVDQAKQAAQFPAAMLAWPGVRGDYDRGLTDGVTKGELTPLAQAKLIATADQLGVAINAKDPMALRTIPWTLIMRPWAERGVHVKLSDGTIGPTVAAELLERVANFTATIESLQGTGL